VVSFAKTAAIIRVVPRVVTALAVAVAMFTAIECAYARGGGGAHPPVSTKKPTPDKDKCGKYLC
jgi:hypothetical protein